MRTSSLRFLVVVAASLGCASTSRNAGSATPSPGPLQIATFAADVTPPVGTRIFDKPSVSVGTPLELKGVVLSDGQTRYVLAALDFVSTSTSGYDILRAKLGEAAGVPPQQVAVHCTHTHSAPTGAHGDTEIDQVFALAGDRGAAALKAALPNLRPLTHVGTGKARVQRFASNRRVPGPNGLILTRWSSVKDPGLHAAPEGTIDPYLRTITFFDHDAPVARLHFYASHPQSFYGDGILHPDTVGWARARFERADGVFQAYFTGAAGNITAGKYNSGTPEDREQLIASLVEGMRGAVADTKKGPITRIALTTSPFTLVPREGKNGDHLRERIQTRPTIELTRLELGPADVVSLPGEPFIEYQLHAQSVRPDRFVCVAGYGDGAAGYILTDEAQGKGGYEDGVAKLAAPTERLLKGSITALWR